MEKKQNAQPKKLRTEAPGAVTVNPALHVVMIALRSKDHANWQSKNQAPSAKLKAAYTAHTLYYCMQVVARSADG